MLTILILLQAAPLSDMQGFDLQRVPRSSSDCNAPVGDEIVVCGRSALPSMRVETAEPPLDPIIPRAEFGLFGKARMSLDTDSTSVGGFTSNRAMVRLKVPF